MTNKCALIRQALAAVVLVALAGCATRQQGAGTTQPLLFIRDVVWDNGYNTVCSITAHLDGTYIWEIKNAHYGGSISPELLLDLQKFANTAAIHIVNGVPTYDYHSEDSYHPQPAAVLKLFQAVMADHPGWSTSSAAH